MSERQITVWVVDDDPSLRWVLDKALRQAKMQTECFERAELLMDALEKTEPDVLLTDVRMPGMDGLALLDRVSREHPDLPVIVMTAHADLETAVAAYRGGAFEYLPKPFDLDEVTALVQKAAFRNGGLPPDKTLPGGITSMIGRAPAMQDVYRSIGRLARSSMTVLITGESGTGKELVARALHDNSPRSDKAFVALNTAAFTEELLESELFGHEKGSFTGADARRIGRFEQAHGGTLFLDEIGDMSPALQTRLLRVLAEREFFRVGGQAAIKVNVRVVAATNQDLAKAVTAGRFREDLYHRLNVIRINTPPLRQRRTDIPLLLTHYLADAAKELDTPAKTLNSKALDLLQAFDWPGNVRQLVNATRRLTVIAPGGVITETDIPADLGGDVLTRGAEKEWTRYLADWAEQQLEKPDSAALLDMALPELERTLITVALKRTAGCRQDAARLLGWGRNTLTRKMRSLAIDEHQAARAPTSSAAEAN